jgi:phosphoribosylaminoimidazolecarboxamide formyltransferase/IMP cyclohydrolase
MKAIISVSDKRGLIPFVQGLQSLGSEMFSTGGTKKALQEAGLAVHGISDLTGFPEILDGRVKTLHPKVHGGLLAKRNNPTHAKEMKANAIEHIDMVAVNLYPFVQTVSKPGVTLDDALENIDIGGPTLIRAAAKNFPAVLVVVDPDDYGWVQERLKTGGVSQEERRKLAQKAFQHVALYDTAIAGYLRGDGDPFTQELTIGLTRLQSLRYGENPHQKAAFYREALSGDGTIASAKQLHGKELSYNNILDADAAWNAARDFPGPTVAVIKHTNPCGLASHSDLAEAYRRAYSGDTVSAFGGIVALNREVDLATAEEIRKIFYEIVIAPGYKPDALALLQKKKDLRILQVPLPKGKIATGLDFRRVTGGMLVQGYDDIAEDAKTWKVVTKRQPTPQELEQLAFAWGVVKHVKSNAIVLVKDTMLAGMGAGQPNRVVSVHLALRAAGEKAKGSVLASDAFFPFPDGPQMALAGGITAIAQPGGSIRDDEVIKAADEAGATMLFTGVRHFKH